MIEESAPELITNPFIVFEEVGAIIGREVFNAPVESKKDSILLFESAISKICGVPLPDVPVTVSPTTPAAVGAIVLAAVFAGTLTKKELLLISVERIVENAGAPPVVALRYWPVVPFEMEERVSAAVVKRSVLLPPNVATPVPPCPTLTVPVLVKFFDASVNTTFDAVRPVKLIVPEEEIPVRPEIAPVALMLPLLAIVNSVAPLADAVKISLELLPV